MDEKLRDYLESFSVITEDLKSVHLQKCMEDGRPFHEICEDYIVKMRDMLDLVITDPHHPFHQKLSPLFVTGMVNILKSCDPILCAKLLIEDKDMLRTMTTLILLLCHAAFYEGFIYKGKNAECVH